jgi:uncharacterized repeat protein (TIGR01451 family)
MPPILRAAALAASLLLATAAAAVAVTPFGPRYVTNAAGDIAVVGNTVLTCPPSPACTAAQGGGVDQNNSFRMRYVDVDGDPATFDSSSVTLTLPPGADVLFAGLYWGGRRNAGGGGAPAPTPGARTAVTLRVPGAPAAAAVTGVEVGAVGTTAYGAFADVTARVRAAGAGVYTVGNVQVGTGSDSYGGWSLVVAHRDDAAPPRNLAVFDGFEVVRDQTGDRSKTITVAGLQAPPAGAVTARVGVVAYDGDRGFTGDVLRLNGTPLTDALHPADDAFNSTVADGGVADTGRDPGYGNLLGFDASVFTADGLIPNGATSAAIALTTGGETYYPAVVTSVIDLYAPRLVVDKAVRDLDGPPVGRDDVLEYTVAVANTGGDAAVDAVLEDTVPPGTAYVPGSLTRDGVPLTDAADADPGEIRGTSVRVGLGTGATGPSAGGTLAIGARTAVTFRVRVDGTAQNGQVLPNTAAVPHRGLTLGTALLARSQTVTSVVSVPDVPTPPLPPTTVPEGGRPGVTDARPALAITTASPPSVRSGRVVCVTATVRNAGAATATGVRITIPVPPGMAVTRRPASSRLSAGRVVSAPLTLRPGARASMTICLRATGGARTLAWTASARADDAAAVRRRTPLRVTAVAAPVRPAVTG